MSTTNTVLALATKESFSKETLNEILKKEGISVSPSVLTTLLNRLVEKKQLERVSRGVFRKKATTKSAFSYVPSEFEICIDGKLRKKFPFLDLCIWSPSCLVPFMRHVPCVSRFIVEADRDAIESVFLFLQEEYPKVTVLLNPNKDVCDRYLHNDQTIIVKPLIKESPLEKRGSCQMPSIEKIMVDVFTDGVFEYLQGSEYYTIAKNIIDNISINKRKMLRYASRRNQKQNIINMLTSIES